MLDKELAKFFMRHADLVNNNDFEALYKAKDAELLQMSLATAKLTLALLSAGIHPLDYLDSVPDKYLYCSPASVRELTTLPEHIKSIGAYAFSSTDVKTINIPEGVTTINTRAFAGCPDLETVRLPSSLTTIYRAAFSKCLNLTKIVYNDTYERWQAINKDTAWLFLTQAHPVKLICTDRTELANS